MQLESLQVYCDVIRFRSFSHAAAANHVTQSAASQTVSQLEKRLGVQLIDRSTRPLGVKPLGQAYYEGCKDLVERFADLEASIRGGVPRGAAPVRVAAIYSVGLGDMGQLVDRFRAESAGAAVHVEYLHPGRVVEKVLDGTADLGLLSFPPRSRELTVIPWREEEMVLTCAPTHALAKCQAVKPAQLVGERFIGFNRDLVIRRKVDRFLREHGVAVDVAFEFDNIETIKKAIEVAAGVALLPEPTLRREVQDGTLVAVPVQGRRLVRPLAVIHRRHHVLSATAQGFLDLLLGANGSGKHSGTPRNVSVNGVGDHPAHPSTAHNRNGAPRTSGRRAKAKHA